MAQAEDIVFCIKPETVTWDTIHDVLWKAHERNRAQGMQMLYPSLPGCEIEKLLGDSGRCFVAMDGDRVVGTCSFKPIKRKNWYSKGMKTAYFILAGVLPEYAGKGVYSRLYSMRQSYVEKQGFNLIEMDTAEKNVSIQHILLKNGFKYVSFKPYSTGGSYAVIMAKWLGECPFANWYCKSMFQAKKYYVKLRYKPGYIKRFRI